MTRRILHVGCGGAPLPDWIAALDCQEEVRLDISPAHEPDVVASMTDMGDIGAFDVLYTGHALEHLYPFDVPKALAEFIRVLLPGGLVIIVVPDLENVRPTEDVLYVSPSGPVCGLDMFYGSRRLSEADIYMAHHSGFVSDTLRRAMVAAGFVQVGTRREKSGYNLVGFGVRPPA